MLPNTGNEDDRYPEGCSIPYGDRVYFNPSASGVSCGAVGGGVVSGHDCLCANTSSYPTDYNINGSLNDTCHVYKKPKPIPGGWQVGEAGSLSVGNLFGLEGGLCRTNSSPLSHWENDKDSNGTRIVILNDKEETVDNMAQIDGGKPKCLPKYKGIDEELDPVLNKMDCGTRIKFCASEYCQIPRLYFSGNITEELCCNEA